MKPRAARKTPQGIKADMLHIVQRGSTKREHENLKLPRMALRDLVDGLLGLSGAGRQRRLLGDYQ